MICYYYPPLLDVGCKRSVAFSKYFKKYGWRPIVLSVKNPDKTYCSVGWDTPPRGVHTEYSYSIVNIYKFIGKLNGLVYRIMKIFGINLKGNRFYDLLCIPDLFWGWIPLTTLKAFNIIRKYHIDCIYVSCPPFSSAIIGILLKKLTERRLIIDFRDPFTVEKLRFCNLPRFRQKTDRKMAKWFVSNADILIVTSEEMRRAYISTYPTVRKKLFTVHNGVDIDLMPNSLPASKFTKFTIVYAGLYFYSPHEWDTEFFFEALALLKKRRAINSRNFQFLFYGEGKEKIDKIVRKYNICSLVVTSSRLPYNKILSVISRSHLQLLRNRNLVIPSKLYDGMFLNVPFLATIPEGEAANIIRKYSPSSYVVTKESAHEVAKLIIDAIEKYRRNWISANNLPDFFKHFSRERLTINLMKILDQNMLKK
jgi:glycosyltransferase involved in cell wall biosynthesis